MDDLLQEMIEPPVSKNDVARRRRLLSTVAILGLAGVGVTSLTTSALFTDRDGVEGNTFTTGTINLGAAAGDWSIAAGNMAPGDTVYSTLTIDNDGSLQLGYAASYLVASDPDGLADFLSIGVRAGTCAGPAANPTGPGTGTVLAATGVNLAAGETPLFGVAGSTVDVAAGDRILDAGESETLCVAVTLDTGAGDALQGKTAELTLTFDSEQTANNTAP